MTIEELFAEEYKSLKKENEELKSYIVRMEKNLDFEEKENTEFRSFLFSLNLHIRKSNYNGKNFIEITNITTTISEENKYYKLISKFAIEDEPKEEDEKCQNKN